MASWLTFPCPISFFNRCPLAPPLTGSRATQVEDNGGGSYSHNEIFGNAGDGMSVLRGGTVSATANKIHDNVGRGMTVKDATVVSHQTPRPSFIHNACVSVAGGLGQRFLRKRGVSQKISEKYLHNIRVSNRNKVLEDEPERDYGFMAFGWSEVLERAHVGNHAMEVCHPLCHLSLVRCLADQ